jgi:AraC family transcriptional regulator
MTATLAFDASAYAADARHRPHRHDELQLSLVLGGAVAETVGGVTEHAGLMSVVWKDAGVVHADEFGPDGARIARLTLQGGPVTALLDDPRRAHDWRWAHDVTVARSFLRLLARARHGETSFDASDVDVVDLLAALTARRIVPASGAPPAWLAQTMEEVRYRWHPGMTAATVARRAGVHPVYLARCVRRWYGTSVSAELRRLRLRSALMAVTESPRTVSDVAHSLGYADEPHLSREVRHAAGLSPGRLRSLLRGLRYGH